MDDFTAAYIEAALWSSTDDDDVPLDSNYDIGDLDLDTKNQMFRDADNFQNRFESLLDDAYEIDEQDESNAGHNFWLTRNGHGAGFWDGDYPTTGEELTTAAENFGQFDLYVGDDEQIYGSG